MTAIEDAAFAAATIALEWIENKLDDPADRTMARLVLRDMLDRDLSELRTDMQARLNARKKKP